MKGIIFNLLEEVVRRRHGEATWDRLLVETGLDGADTTLGSYPDSQLETLVAAVSGVLGWSRNECLRWFGRAAMPLIAERYPAFFTPYSATLPFLISVNTIIHPEVRKVHPGALCPLFRFAHAPDGVLHLSYESSRQLCALAEGFVEGAADYFGETVTVEHLLCTARGARECCLAIRAHAAEAVDAA
ncbi:MAG: heme NO-binding domain-containing protein [Stellaceae bacterium]